MTTTHDGQPVGPALDGWTAPPFPPREPMAGRLVKVIPLEPDAHAAPLFESLAGAPETLWTYMTFGPFTEVGQLAAVLRAMVETADWSPYVFEVDGRLLGFASYLRIQPADGVIEIGAIVLAPALQRTTAATEALFLMIDNVFDLGYRRCEWKCDDLNAPSREAAVRLGFTHEGTFRQATHYKGRNRDTAWYSITDREWPGLATAFREWLAPENFDETGKQRRSLQQIREE
ncbi:MAG TPA: GNAT family protein [Acidimicrobiia bacterium]|jgi:RimJ/RimL family protein N-acetyltransferase|nr:GNAT family protein [Acidimicrobiia bacterium]